MAGTHSDRVGFALVAALYPGLLVLFLRRV